MDPAFLTISQAVAVSGLTRGVLARRIKDGTLPTFTTARNRRLVLVRREDLDALSTPTRRQPEPERRR